MNFPRTRAAWPVLLAIVLGLTTRFPSPAQTPAGTVGPDDVFSLRNDQLYLGGKLYAEMSFNKFDLVWEIWDGIQTRDKTGDLSALKTAIARQDLALSSLHQMGFRTLRMFGMPFAHDASSLAQALGRKPLFEAIDTTLDLCEKDGIQVVFSLGLGQFAYDGEKRPAPGGAPESIPLYTDPDSKSRKDCYAYLDDIVNRYKGRKAVAMWEVSNELTNLADIGVREGRISPTLPQVAEFFDSTAKRIKQDDPLRLVSDGGSALREAAWHRWHEQSWTKDSFEQYREAYAAYFQQSAIDVVDTHYYSLRKGGLRLADGPDGKPVWMTPAPYVDLVHSLGKGAIIAEYGTLPSGWVKQETGKGDLTSDWFQGYADPHAAKWVQKGVDDLVNSKASLAYWWAYQSDRPVDQFADPVTFSVQTTPALMKIIADGNRRLKAAVGAPIPPP